MVAAVALGDRTHPVMVVVMMVARQGRRGGTTAEQPGDGEHRRHSLRVDQHLLLLLVDGQVVKALTARSSSECSACQREGGAAATITVADERPVTRQAISR